MKIGEIMTTDVKWIEHDATVEDLERFLIQSRASGVPVCSGPDNLVGIVSKTDLIRYLSCRNTATDPEVDGDTHVWQIMTPDVLTAQVDDDVRSIAETMLAEGVHRVIVYRGDDVAGIATSFDMLRAVMLEK